jgi:hypothetical protein
MESSTEPGILTKNFNYKVKVYLPINSSIPVSGEVNDPAVPSWSTEKIQMVFWSTGVRPPQGEIQ